MPEPKTYPPAACPRSTPWGRPDSRTLVAPGVWTVSTPSHGGYFLSPERNADVPEEHRRANGWYEEDCDWATVAITFPELFAPDALELAHRTRVQVQEWRRLDRERAALVAAGVPIRRAVERIPDAPDGARRLLAIYETAAGPFAMEAPMSEAAYDLHDRRIPEHETYRYVKAEADRLGIFCGDLRPKERA